MRGWADLSHISAKMAVSKQVASSIIDDHTEELRSLSVEIWKNPELDFQEHFAHKLLTDFLESKGFSVDRGYCGLETAFRAR